MPALHQSAHFPRSGHSLVERSASGPGRRLFLALCAGLALTSLWAAGASYFLLFHDEMIARFVSQQRAMQFDYEERLGALQLQLDKAATDRAVVRAGIESRLATIAERQAQIEKRHGLISGLTGVPAVPVPMPAAAQAYAPAETSTRPLKPFPTPEAPGSSAPGLRMFGDDRAELPGRLSRLDQRLDRLAEGQASTVAAIGEQAGRNGERYRDLIQQAGIEPARFARALPIGQGGPLMPLGADAFSLALVQTRQRIDEETHLRKIAGALPLRRPLRREAVQTSTFGARLDPFTRGYAMHTGIDFRAETGVPAVATAAGRVTAAEPTGGYGHMVEVDHGHGVFTRYAHLSGYAVSAGQSVGPGAVLGYVGSTGRSTGSHLHYETRIDGEPVDPQRFLRAGAQLVFSD